MNYQLKIIKKKNISQNQIFELCRLKQKIWNFDMESQIKWWINNSKEDYLIVSFLNKKKVFAFLKIRTRYILIEMKKIKCGCITEVSVEKNYQKMGWGKKLINEAKKILKSKEIPGYLLCSKNQREFYKKCNLKQIKNFFIISNLNESKIKKESSYCFGYNLDNLEKKISLIGDNF